MDRFQSCRSAELDVPADLAAEKPAAQRSSSYESLKTLTTVTTGDASATEPGARPRFPSDGSSASGRRERRRSSAVDARRSSAGSTRSSTLRRANTQNLDANATPEAFGLSEVVLGAHRAVAHKLRRDDDAAVARTIRLLKSFVPGIVRADVAEQTATRVAKRTGAVLFADASGFTNLAEQMGADKDGVERLTSTLNAFFGVLIDIVHDHGGDIVQFSGDALTVLWICGEACGRCERANCGGGDIAPVLKTVADAAALAAACALAMQAVVDDDADTPLRLHMGLGCGDLTTAHLGGVRGRWAFVLDGDVMRQVARAEPAAAPGEVVLSPEAAAALEATDERTRVAADGLLERPFSGDDADLARFGAGSEAPGLAAVAAELLPDKTLLDASAAGCTSEAVRRDADRATRLLAYVPASVCRQLAADRREEALDVAAAELRCVSVVFVHAGDAGSAAADSELVPCLQRAIGAHEGDMNKVLVDDKGLLCLAVFGLPPLAHVDDARRATAAACACVRDLATLGASAVAGVATGDVFCGLVGSSRRREFTVMGAVVNLAARLMAAAAAAPSGVLVDVATKRAVAAAGGGVAFDEKPRQLQLKGITRPVAAHEPSHLTKPTPRLFLRDDVTDDGGQADAVERSDRLLKQFATPARALWGEEDSHETGGGGVLCVGGPVGAGAHAVLDRVVGAAERRGWATIRASADVDDDTSRNADVRLDGWPAALALARPWVLGVAAASKSDWRDLVPPPLRPFESLVDAVLGNGDGSDAGLDAEAAEAIAITTIVHLVRAGADACREPVVLAADVRDSSSSACACRGSGWRLLNAVGRVSGGGGGRGLIVVVAGAARDFRRGAAKELWDLADRADAAVSLRAMDAGPGFDSYVFRCLGVESAYVPDRDGADAAPSLIDFAMEYSGGLSGNAREICASFVDRGVVQIVPARAGAPARARLLRTPGPADVPPRMARAIEVDYEGLPDEARTVLQAAATLDEHAFTFAELVIASDVVRSVIDVDANTATLPEQLHCAAIVEGLLRDDVLQIVILTDDDASASRSTTRVASSRDASETTPGSSRRSSLQRQDAAKRESLVEVQKGMTAAVEGAAAQATPRLKFRNRGLREYVKSAMSWRKRASLKQAMHDWQSSHKLAESVAQQVRDANFSVLRSYRDVVKTALAENEGRAAFPRQMSTMLEDAGATRKSGLARAAAQIVDAVRRPATAPQTMFGIFDFTTRRDSGTSTDERRGSIFGPLRRWSSSAHEAAAPTRRRSSATSVRASER